MGWCGSCRLGRCTCVAAAAAAVVGARAVCVCGGGRGWGILAKNTRHMRGACPHGVPHGRAALSHALQADGPARQLRGPIKVLPDARLEELANVAKLDVACARVRVHSTSANYNTGMLHPSTTHPAHPTHLTGRALPACPSGAAPPPQPRTQRNGPAWRPAFAGGRSGREGPARSAQCASHADVRHSMGRVQSTCTCHCSPPPLRASTTSPLTSSSKGTSGTRHTSTTPLDSVACAGHRAMHGVQRHAGHMEATHVHCAVRMRSEQHCAHIRHADAHLHRNEPRLPAHELHQTNAAQPAGRLHLPGAVHRTRQCAASWAF